MDHTVFHEWLIKQTNQEDGSFVNHQKGPITVTYTADWNLKEGEYRRKLGEWLKSTSVCSQDQRRML